MKLSWLTIILDSEKQSFIVFRNQLIFLVEEQGKFSSISSSVRHGANPGTSLSVCLNGQFGPQLLTVLYPGTLGFWGQYLAKIGINYEYI